MLGNTGATNAVFGGDPCPLIVKQGCSTIMTLVQVHAPERQLDAQPLRGWALLRAAAEGRASRAPPGNPGAPGREPLGGSPREDPGNLG